MTFSVPEHLSAAYSVGRKIKVDLRWRNVLERINHGLSRSIIGTRLSTGTGHVECCHPRQAIQDGV
jgi:hypothetical protein